MHAIISEIDPESSKKVSQIWRKLFETCELEAIYNFPTPHFTWLIAQELKIDAVNYQIAVLADQCPRVETYTSGFGIFSGENPVLYFPLVKSLEMIHFHQKIWEHIQPYSTGQNRYYSPAKWLPHITLALKDLNSSNLACAVDALIGEPHEFFVSMTSLAIVESEENEIGKILKRCAIGG